MILETWRPGVAARLGIRPGDVPERAVYCSITGFGSGGRHEQRAGHDLNYQGWAGVLADTAPAWPPVQVADLAAGALGAVTEVLAALLARERTGRGGHVVVSMTHGTHRLASHRLAGDPLPRLLTGGLACYRTYACADGRYLTVGALEAKFFARLCELLGRPELAAGQYGPEQEDVGGDARRHLRDATARGLAPCVRRRGRVRRPGRDARGGRRRPRHAAAGPRGRARRAHRALAAGAGTLSAAAAAAVLAALAVAAPPAGHSAQGRPIPVVEVAGARARTPVLVVGSIHGDEPAGIAVAQALEHAKPPAGVALWIVPDLNPDGVAAGTRQNAHGVDLNRNFPTGWRRQTGVFASGPKPLSEPESLFAYRLILRVRPVVSIWFHQHENLVDTSSGDVALERRFAALAGLPVGNLPRYGGSAVTWENHRFPGTTPFVVELPTGKLSAARVQRTVHAILALAATAAVPK